MSPAKAPSEITRLLEEWNNSDRSAFERLVPLVYDELRGLAAALSSVYLATRARQ